MTGSVAETARTIRSMRRNFLATRSLFGCPNRVNAAPRRAKTPPSLPISNRYAIKPRFVISARGIVVLCQRIEFLCHCLTVPGQAVLFDRKKAEATASPKTPMQWHRNPIEKFPKSLWFNNRSIPATQCSPAEIERGIIGHRKLCSEFLIHVDSKARFVAGIEITSLELRTTWEDILLSLSEQSSFLNPEIRNRQVEMHIAGVSYR